MAATLFWQGGVAAIMQRLHVLVGEQLYPITPDMASDKKQMLNLQILAEMRILRMNILETTSAQLSKKESHATATVTISSNHRKVQGLFLAALNYSTIFFFAHRMRQVSGTNLVNVVTTIIHVMF